MSDTPLQRWNYIQQVYSDPAATMGGGTPLILSVGKTGRSDDDLHVVVKLKLLESYEAMIFELQTQVLRYKVLLDQLLPRPAAAEELRLNPQSLSVNAGVVLSSLCSPQVNIQMRGYLEPEDD
jgi:hypothetical protein